MMHIYNNEPEDYSQEAKNILSSVGYYHECQPPPVVDVIITRLKHQIDRSFLNNYPDLKYILTATTGLNHIDITECRERDIQIISLKGETEFLSDIAATAEHTIGLMLSLLRNIPQSFNDVKLHNWDRMTFKGHELKGRNLCILGLGRLGIQVARIGQTFGMNIQCFDKHTSTQYRTTTDLDEALTNSDVVSVHLPYDNDTHHLLKFESIMKTNPNAYIINTSRGQIIKEIDLVQCLTNGHLAGVAVDVLENEPNVSISPLLRYSLENTNVLITPHIGGCTYESMEATEIFIAQQFSKIVLHPK
ncbi:MAG: hypothetical protein CMF45_00925 [Legionellales bacterium]|nr:hypothetical protein [Legionellales bacterium]|tara:strand:- start:6038 stop:6949 length:912 start_codon:yes stop_codon:yes gene_type:complete